MPVSYAFDPINKDCYICGSVAGLACKSASGMQNVQSHRERGVPLFNADDWTGRYDANYRKEPVGGYFKLRKRYKA